MLNICTLTLCNQPANNNPLTNHRTYKHYYVYRHSPQLTKIKRSVKSKIQQKKNSLISMQPPPTTVLTHPYKLWLNGIRYGRRKLDF